MYMNLGSIQLASVYDLNKEKIEFDQIYYRQLLSYTFLTIKQKSK